MSKLWSVISTRRFILWRMWNEIRSDYTIYNNTRIIKLDSHINKSVNHSTSSSVTSPNAISKEQPTVNQYNNIESSQTQDAPDYTSYQQRYGNPSASSQKLNLLSKKVKIL